MLVQGVERCKFGPYTRARTHVTRSVARAHGLSLDVSRARRDSSIGQSSVGARRLYGKPMDSGFVLVRATATRRSRKLAVGSVLLRRLDRTGFAECAITEAELFLQH